MWKFLVLRTSPGLQVPMIQTHTSSLYCAWYSTFSYSHHLWFPYTFCLVLPTAVPLYFICSFPESILISAITSVKKSSLLSSNHAFLELTLQVILQLAVLTSRVGAGWSPDCCTFDPAHWLMCLGGHQEIIQMPGSLYSHGRQSWSARLWPGPSLANVGIWQGGQVMDNLSLLLFCGSIIQIHIYMWMCIYVCVYVRIYTYIHIHIFTCSHIHRYTYTRIQCTHINGCVNIYLNIYIYF